MLADDVNYTAKQEHVTGIPSNTAGIQLCSQSSPPLLHSSQAPIHSSMMVGTLSYMSPEAFMCNETDADGNTIKCGRPSDIWSLGCILYQMVYGKTPFADFKTFWVEFKVIGDDKPMLVAAFIFSGQDVLAASGI